MSFQEIDYSEPMEHTPCHKCEYRNYDTWHDETWCGHHPPPSGLGERLIVDKWGGCAYWKVSIFYKDDF